MVSQDQDWADQGPAAPVEHAELMPVCFASSPTAANRYCELLSSFGIFALTGEQGLSRAGSPVLVETVAYERASEVLACTESSGPLLDDGEDADSMIAVLQKAQADDADEANDDDEEWDDDDDDDDDASDRSDPAP